LLFDQLPVTRKAELGQHILKRFANRASRLPKEQQVALEGIQKKIDVLNNFKKSDKYGAERLKKMARTEAPVQFAISDFLEGLGIPGKTGLAVLSFLKIGVPHTAGAVMTAKLLHKIAVSKKVQTAFLEASKSHAGDPVKFFMAIDQLGKLMEEEND